MILLFILFVVLFSFTYKKLKASEFKQIMASIRNQPVPKNPIDEVKTQLTNWVKSEKLSDQIDVIKKEDAVLIEIKDKVFFTTGEYELNFEGQNRIHTLAKTLEKLPSRFQLGIEGHTDDVPIHNKAVEDNWDLSSKRALNVLRALNLSPELLKRTSVIAHGDTNPLVPNRDAHGNSIAENQNKNRRVTLRVF
jgi:chemotaxis protein MotB